MAPLSRTSLRFLGQYTRDYPNIQQAARLAENLVRYLIISAGVQAHVITSRAKTPESVRAKLRRKRYPRPAEQLTDAIGIRVITYYSTDVDRVLDTLKAEFQINANESLDRRLSLAPREFGYRSVHLIARIRGARARSPEYTPLVGRWFEIQVRSILEHAWAEIEHEIIYKGGIKYPNHIVRRFAAVAGALEILGNEFGALNKIRDDLIENYRRDYSDGRGLRKKLDVARLLGFLEAMHPQGRGWRQAADMGVPFAPGIEVSCVEALHTVGLKTAESLNEVMRSSTFRRAVRSFASSQGIDPTTASHLALTVIALAVTDPSVLEEQFPEMVRDPSIDSIVQRQARR